MVEWDLSAGWPAPGETIDVVGDAFEKEFHVVDYDDDRGARLKNGDDGQVGLYRLIREDDDAVVQYHQKKGDERVWRSAHRKADHFDMVDPEAPSPDDVADWLAGHHDGQGEAAAEAIRETETDTDPETMTEPSATDDEQDRAFNYRTDDDPFAADDQQRQHILRAMELLELMAKDGEVEMRTVYDALAHIRLSAVLSIAGEAEETFDG